jgi:hypothetical protein
VIPNDGIEQASRKQPDGDDRKRERHVMHKHDWLFAELRERRRRNGKQVLYSHLQSIQENHSRRKLRAKVQPVPHISV